MVSFQGQVTGWGRTAEGGPLSSTLMKARVPIRSDQECIDAYKPANIRIGDHLQDCGASTTLLQTEPPWSVPARTGSMPVREILEVLWWSRWLMHKYNVYSGLCHHKQNVSFDFWECNFVYKTLRSHCYIDQIKKIEEIYITSKTVKSASWGLIIKPLGAWLADLQNLFIFALFGPFF